MSEAFAPVALCPRCEEPMRSVTVRTDVWEGERLFVVEDIPAQCVIHALSSTMMRMLRTHCVDSPKTNFPADEVRRELVVPVFSLAGRIRTTTAAPDYEQS